MASTHDILISGKVASLPDTPGVYQFFDAGNKLLYVGKAKSLKNRVRSYFVNPDKHSGKTRRLVRMIQDIQFILVETEYDALLLENTLIKRYQPPYNVMLKDDKTYPWICIKKERFPRVFSTRKLVKDGSEYFGPYASGKLMNTLLDLIKQLYPLRTCNLNLSSENIEMKKFRVCLEYHIGNCKGPCEGLQSEEEYNQVISEIRQIIKGNTISIIGHLKKVMQEHVERLEFEKAHLLKEKIELLENYQSKSTVVSTTIHNVDVVYPLPFQSGEAGNGLSSGLAVNYLKVMNGAIVQAHTIELKSKLDETEQELFEKAIIELRERFGSESPEIILPYPLELEIPGITVTVPQRGDKKKLLELAERNLNYFILERKKSEVRSQELEVRSLEQLQKDLRLSELPAHIECFDNSNFQGDAAVAACVVFKNGKSAKSEYRHFNIRTVAGPDDFASMQEVIFRRYKRLLDEQQRLPQLVIVDGGKGQLSSAVEAMTKLGIYGKIALIGIAKKLEEIYVPGDSLPLYIDKRSSSLRLIQNMRDEAHRFGITHHREKLKKMVVKSELEEIKGIGYNTMQKLLWKFKSVKRIRKATEKELSEAVGKAKAKIVFEYFRNAGSAD